MDTGAGVRCRPGAETTCRIADSVGQQASPGVRLVVIDGPAGAGKSTLAAELADALEATGWSTAVVALDDLYEGWEGLASPGFAAHLESWIAVPLRHGLPPHHPVYDWSAGRFAGWSVLPQADVVIVEGVGAAHPVLAGIADVRVWIDAPPDVRRERLQRRAGPPPEEWLAAWQQQESAYFTAVRPRRGADWILTHP